MPTETSTTRADGELFNEDFNVNDDSVGDDDDDEIQLTGRYQ